MSAENSAEQGYEAGILTDSIEKKPCLAKIARFYAFRYL